MEIWAEEEDPTVGMAARVGVGEALTAEAEVERAAVGTARRGHKP